MTISPAAARSDPRNAHLPLLNQPQTILGTTITLLSIAVLAASLRLWSRFRDRLWGWDDAFVFLACIASIAGDSMVCRMPYNGLGLHFYTLGASDIESYFFHVWSTNVAYCASTTLIKLAILFQYKRLMAETTTSTSSSQYRLAKKCIWTLIIVIAVWGFSFFILSLVPCHPIAKYWNLALEGKCVGWGSKDPVQFFSMWVGHTSTNMFLDVVVLLFPLPFLGTMQIAGKSRVGLIALFAMGGVVAMMSIGRLITLCIKRAGTVPIPDMTYYTPSVYIFSVLEVNLAILCASIPIFWPIISTLAANKILVVNEIVVHVEEYQKTSMDGQSGIGLTSQSAFKSPPQSPGAEEHHTSRFSNIARSLDPRTSRDLPTAGKRKSKSSIASSIGRPFSRPDTHRGRSSQDSQHILYKATSRETGSLSRSDYDWFTELDKDSVGKRTTTTIESGGDSWGSPKPSQT